MCGIGGYSIHSESRVNRTLAAQALLAGIAERGADAAGYAWRGPGRKVAVHKQRAGASSLLEQIAIPHGATQVLVHVRAYTKGHPAVTANNHPIRHRSVVGIHNGTIENDGAIFARLERGRDAPEMTVDSEAIFALADASGNSPKALEQLHGSMAAAWLDEREAGIVHLARGSRRPLWIGQGAREVFFASTPHALGLLARTLRLRLKLTRLDEGTAVAVAGGIPGRPRRFEPHHASADRRIPSLAAPQEAHRCRCRLAALVSRADQR